jgi:hypothetical protein
MISMNALPPIVAPIVIAVWIAFFVLMGASPPLLVAALCVALVAMVWLIKRRIVDEPEEPEPEEEETPRPVP